MEQLINVIVAGAGLTGPILTILAISSLFIRPAGCECPVAQMVFFVAFLFVSGLTMRSVVVDDSAWLTQAASLGVLVVAGVLRKPQAMRQVDDASMLLN